ncbi:MAG: hypothetical protein ACI9YT_002655, partial [Halobacteriales archaeon]
MDIDPVSERRRRRELAISGARLRFVFSDIAGCERECRRFTARNVEGTKRRARTLRGSGTFGPRSGVREELFVALVVEG